jgi:hypothetical protein
MESVPWNVTANFPLDSYEPSTQKYGWAAESTDIHDVVYVYAICSKTP